MDGIRGTLKYVLALPNGQYYSRFEEHEKDVFCTGYFKDKIDLIDAPSLRKQHKGKWDASIDYLKILNEFKSQLRTKGVDTFFLSEDESKLLVGGVRGLIKSHLYSYDPKIEVTFKSNGENIEIILTSSRVDTGGLRSGNINLRYRPKSEFSFQLDVHNIRYLRTSVLNCIQK